MRSFTILAIWLVAVLTVTTSSARAEARLLMIEEKWCEWCERWNDEIGVVYDKTVEGKQARLLRADIHEPLPAGIDLAGRPRYTPTFILLDDGREVGRIEGYPGEDFFWPMLQQLLDRLPAKSPGAKVVVN